MFPTRQRILLLHLSGKVNHEPEAHEDDHAGDAHDWWERN